jgi:hypothetical protein
MSRTNGYRQRENHRLRRTRGRLLRRVPSAQPFQRKTTRGTAQRRAHQDDAWPIGNLTTASHRNWHLAIAKTEFHAMLRDGRVRRPESSCSSALHLVPKKDKGWPPCDDYRVLRDRTVPDRYTVRHIHDYAHHLPRHLHPVSHYFMAK